MRFPSWEDFLKILEYLTAAALETALPASFMLLLALFPLLFSDAAVALLSHSSWLLFVATFLESPVPAEKNEYLTLSKKIFTFSISADCFGSLFLGSIKYSKSYQVWRCRLRCCQRTGCCLQL